MTPVSSPRNALIRQIRALHSRKERERSGCFLAEGLHIVTEAVQTSAPIELLLVAPDLLTSPGARAQVAQQQRAGVCTVAVTAEVFRSISRRERPAGLAAVVRQRWQPLPREVTAGDYWVALDAAQDPGNVGSILRSSDAAGGAGVIVLGQGTDPHHPTAVRASMGAIFSQRLMRADTAELFTWACRHGCTVIGASGQGARDYRTAVYRTPLVLLMGAERHGLAADVLAQCDSVVRIPMLGRTDSLNLATATSLLLYEVAHQHHERRRLDNWPVSP